MTALDAALRRVFRFAARSVFRLLYRPTLAVGRAQAWFAAGYREGTALERFCIWPSWAISRILFIGLLAACEAIA